MERLKIILFGSFFLLTLNAFGQENEVDSIFIDVDSLYREDQIFIGFTYNILTGLPENISQSGFSGGIHAGFIRDFPLNERRNIALGVGLGWSFNTYGQNLFIGETEEEETIFRALNDTDIDYETNRFSTQSIDVPVQFRWRTSDFDKYKFWRIYTGLKLSYVYYFKSTFSDANNVYNQTKVPEFNRLRMGATFTFGYNTFNFHFYYSLIPFFNKDALLNGQPIELSTLQIGLMFYIL